MSNKSKPELMEMHKKDGDLLNKANQKIKIMKEHIKKQGQELEKTRIELAELTIEKKRTITLYGLIVDNKGGTSLSLFKSEDQARNSLYFEYIMQFWSTVTSDDDRLGQYSRDEAIDRYFEKCDEWYCIEPSEIEI